MEGKAILAGIALVILFILWRWIRRAFRRSADRRYRNSRVVRRSGANARGQVFSDLKPLSDKKIRELRDRALQANVHEACGYKPDKDDVRARRVLDVYGIPLEDPSEERPTRRRRR